MKIFKFILFLTFLLNSYFIKSNLISDDYIKQYFNKDYIEALEDNNFFSGFLLEFEYDDRDKCYKNKNFGAQYNLNIKKSADGNFVKEFKNADGSLFEKNGYGPLIDEENTKECGHFFKIKVKDSDEKTYYIYLSFNKKFWYGGGSFCNTFKKEEKDGIEIDKKLIEFESIYCFEFISYCDFFYNCINLEKAVLKNRNKNDNKVSITAKRNHSSRVFKGCKKLKNVDLSEFYLLYDSDYGFTEMFSGCEKIENLILNNPENETHFTRSFINCKNIKNITFINKDKNIVVGSECFTNCKNLENLNDIENKLYLNNQCAQCFKNCKKIKNLKLNIDESKFDDFYYHFKKQSKDENLNEEETKKCINQSIDFSDSLTGTDIDNLEITIADNIDLKIFASHIETLVKSGKVENFIFNGVSIKISECADLNKFINNPKEYVEELENNKKEQEQINNSSQDISSQDNLSPDIPEIDKKYLCCLFCCKCCCCIR